MKNISRLVVVAGASCIGKTWMIQQMMKGRFPELRRTIGMGNPEEWSHVGLSRLSGREQSCGKYIVQYDAYNKGRCRVVSGWIAQADQSVVLTLCAPPQLLIRRHIHRLLKNILAIFLKPCLFRDRWQKVSGLWVSLVEQEHSKEKVVRAYKNFFEFLEEQPVEHYCMHVNRPADMFRYADNPSAPFDIIRGG